MEAEELGRGGRLRGDAAGELVAAAYAAESAHGPRLARGLSLADLTHAVALESRRVKLPHRDPADRFLAATARVHDVALVTADARLIAARPCKLLANR